MSTNPFVTMQQKRGLKANLPASAPAGQLLIATDTKELFFGTGTGRDQIGSDVIVARTKYVSLTGDNTNGNGSISKPYATISAALASITDATTTNRYVIRVLPGLYSEASTVSLKANVYIVGDHYQAVRYNANFTIDNTSFAGGNDNRSGMSQIMIQGFTADFKTALSTAGKVYFEDVTFIGAFSCTSYHSVNQCLMDGCNFFGTVTFDGMNTRIVNTQFESSAPLNLVQSTSTYSSHGTGVVLHGCYIASAVTVTGTTKSVVLYAYNSILDSSLTINGATASVQTTAESVPNKASITLSNGGTLGRKDDSFAIAFAPADATKWSSSPTNVMDAIDTLAASTYTYTFTQTSAATTWIINHNLNKRPSITTVDNAGNIIDGEVVYNSNNQITVYFSPALAGFAYLN